MQCGYCHIEITNGIIKDNIPFCNNDHAEEHRKEVADAYARSQGFSSYEDMAEHYGHAVIK